MVIKSLLSLDVVTLVLFRRMEGCLQILVSSGRSQLMLKAWPGIRMISIYLWCVLHHSIYGFPYLFLSLLYFLLTKKQRGTLFLGFKYMIGVYSFDLQGTEICSKMLSYPCRWVLKMVQFKVLTSGLPSLDQLLTLSQVLPCMLMTKLFAQSLIILQHLM